MTASKLALALIAGTLSGAAAASSLTAQEVLQQFNLVTLRDTDSTNPGQRHVDGRSYIGGSVDGGDYAQHAGDIARTSSDYAGLTVAVSAANVHVNSNGAVIAGSLTNGIVQGGGTAIVFGDAVNSNFNDTVKAYVGGKTTGTSFGGGELKSQTAVDKAATTLESAGNPKDGFATLLTGLSSSLSHLNSAPGTSKNLSEAITDNPYYPTTTFHAVATNGIAVFNVTSADLGAKQFQFDYGNASTVIINVKGKDVDIGANFLGDNIASTLATNTIWNFFEAKTVDIVGNSFGGTVLAPYAHLTNGNPYNGGTIEGSVLVNSLTQNAEIHMNNFKGDVSSLVTNVPEPETYAMMLGGLALMAGIARRRRVA